MSSSLLKSSLFLAFLSSAAFAVPACGGRAIEYAGDGGSSSGSGSGGSSGGGSGGSSGSSSGVSGGSSGGGSGSSSGGTLPCPVNPPAGACSYEGQYCDYGQGCGVSCDCIKGNWECSIGTCPPPVCPGAPPYPGQSCGPDGTSCSYPGSGGGLCGGEDCTCAGGTWQCSGQACPPPTCPSSPPGNYDSCNQYGALCDYPINGNVCSTWECGCYGSGTWSCYETNCWDAGSGSSGSSSGGWADAGSGAD